MRVFIEKKQAEPSPPSGVPTKDWNVRLATVAWKDLRRERVRSEIVRAYARTLKGRDESTRLARERIVWGKRYE